MRTSPGREVCGHRQARGVRTSPGREACGQRQGARGMRASPGRERHAGTIRARGMRASPGRERHRSSPRERHRSSSKDRDREVVGMRKKTKRVVQNSDIRKLACARDTVVVLFRETYTLAFLQSGWWQQHALSRPCLAIDDCHRAPGRLAVSEVGATWSPVSYFVFVILCSMCLGDVVAGFKLNFTMLCFMCGGDVIAGFKPLFHDALFS
ncbi:hypothetical protein VNO80_10214 [Phaseolus coccineus]|uniref:Uncharacterized protein n=1 Tax=Phaseolus coccineus TaxID=3886 RepID=A0AAN9N7N9_PHACN